MHKESNISTQKTSKVQKKAAVLFFLAGSAAGTWSSVTEGLVVKVVFSMTWANTLEVGDIASKLLDGLNLLMQEVALNEVRHLCE